MSPLKTCKHIPETKVLKADGSIWYWQCKCGGEHPPTPVECTCPDYWFPPDRREKLRALPHNACGILAHHTSCKKYM